LRDTAQFGQLDLGQAALQAYFTDALTEQFSGYRRDGHLIDSPLTSSPP
jgi:hypothetical protein